MKNLFYITLLTLILISCKKNTETKSTEVEIIEPAISVAQKIANAHGFDTWKYVSEIEFTFNDNRHWVWKPKTNNVSLIMGNDTISYSRKKVDSTLTKTDGAFTNDKFWLLIPFQLIWDKNATISSTVIDEAPISKTQLNKITLTYSNESGGYTPGDAYDIFFNDDFLIQEWVFRRGNQPESSLINTFENYQNYKGIKIASDHKNAEDTFNLKLSNIKITL
ncbi:MAG: hypothetical protein NWQ07_07410 [Flaviramulus sp.]|nr:hypothetical protein [Flaviramulus sp.]